MADRVGQRFGDYLLKSLISDRGAFADVYEGEHILDQTRVTVKVWKMQIEARTFLNDVHAAVLKYPHMWRFWILALGAMFPTWSWHMLLMAL